MVDKKSFVFYHEWGEILKKLPVEEVGNITLALIAYSECGIVPTLSPIADIAFTAFKQVVDRDFEKWKSTCQIRAENGRKGGRPKKANGFSDNQNKPNGFLAFSKKTKKLIMNMKMIMNMRMRVINMRLTAHHPRPQNLIKRNLGNMKTFF